VVLADWASPWAFWAFGVMAREELKLLAMMMMIGYDLWSFVGCLSDYFEQV
jgi:hypothetical protein